MPPHITRKTPKSILTPATGFLAGYSHTLNPYAGCAFGCSYCYVRRMPVALFRGEEWGTWVEVKEKAAEVLLQDLRKAKRKGRVTIFMSSATDPYQPAEYRERLTRSLLEAMTAEPPAFLFLQTRSPLVTRDIDILSTLGNRLLVSMTVETDLEPVRKAFSPAAPPVPARMKALRKLKEAGIPTQAAVSPVLPFTRAFPRKLAEVTDRVCLDDFFLGDGSGGRRTEQLKVREIYERLGFTRWYGKETIRRVIGRFEEEFGLSAVFVSQEGFLPPKR
jgi:DNA repair photolyase